MMTIMATRLSANALAYFKKQGAKGGKRSLETMTAEARVERARKAGLARAAKARAKETR